MRKHIIIVVIVLLYSFLGVNMLFATANTWTQKADFGGAARYGAVGFAIGSKGYIGTGDDGSYKKDFWEYDPTANTWTQKADFGGTARAGAVGFSIGSKGYIGTGYQNYSCVKDFWEYDPSANTWTRKADFGGTARRNAIGFSIGSKGYIGTGICAPSEMRDFWEYDPATNTWTQKADCGGATRSDAVAFSVENKGYIGTGYAPSQRKDFWEYNPAANTWTQKADFVKAVQANAVGFSIGSKGYIGTAGYFGEYEPAANTWTQKADFKGASTQSAVGFSIGSKGYIGTGWGGTYYNAFWEYTPSTSSTPLYFSHIATGFGWQTEIAIINTGNQTVTGTLKGYSDAGQLVETKAVTLSAYGRRQIIVANEFTNHTSIGYIIFDTNFDTVQGYTKFYIIGTYRVGIPAVKEVNTSDIYIPHIASTSQWWTGVSLVNTTSTAKQLTITFNNGQSRQVTLNANEHKAFMIESLLSTSNQSQPDLQSAVITNASGVIGLVLFGGMGGNNQLDGVPLTDRTTSTLYFHPGVAGVGWWTGIAAYNPSTSASTITVKPYSFQGAPLSSSTLSIGGKQKYFGVVSNLGLPAETAWFRIDATMPLTGFELFGSDDGNQLAAYAGGGGTGAKTGVFPKIEKNGWTYICFVNTEATAASVTLKAYNDSGTVIATEVLSVGGHAQRGITTESIFSQDIGSATYIAYSSDRNIEGFQLNGSLDGMMLDGLPGLGGDGTAQKNSIIIGLVEDASSPILALATGQDGKETFGFVRNDVSNSTVSIKTNALLASGIVSSSTSSPFDIIYSFNNETVIVSLNADGTPNTFDDPNGLRGVFSNHTDSTASLTIYKDNIIVGGPMKVSVNNADIRSRYQNCPTCSVIPTPLDNHQWTAADTWRVSAAVLSGVGCAASVIPIITGVGTPIGIAWATYACGSLFLSAVIDDKTTQDYLNIVKLPIGATQCAVLGTEVIIRQYGPALTMVPGCFGALATAIANSPQVSPLASISVTPANPSIAVGSTKQFTATGTYSNGTTSNITTQVAWSSSNTSVATVNVSSGLAAGVAAGNSTITATLGSISGSTTLTVTGTTLASISVTPANPSIAVGSTKQFTATGTYSNGTTSNITTQVAWSSSNTSVATVNVSSGLAAGVAAGNSTITATLGSISGSTTLTVTGTTGMTVSVSITGERTVVSGYWENETAKASANYSIQYSITNAQKDSSGTTGVMTVVLQIYNGYKWFDGDKEYLTLTNSSGTLTGLITDTVRWVATSSRKKMRVSINCSANGEAGSYVHQAYSNEIPIYLTGQ
jgi:uncharacterized protein YjdB